MLGIRDTWQVPAALLGARGEEPAPAALVRVAPPDALAESGGGLVYHGETFELREDGEVEPIEAGLYDEDTFGLLPRTARGGVDLTAYDGPSFARRPQIVRSGEVFLAAAVLSPWLRRHGLDRVAEATGIGLEEVEGVLRGRLALAGDGSLAAARDLDGEATATYGAKALSRLARSRGRWLEGVSRTLPVLPAGLRPATVRGGRLLLPDPTHLYEHVIDASETATRCLELVESPRFQASAVAELQRRVEALVLDGLDAEGRPLDPGESPAIRPLAASLTGDFGGGCLGELAAAEGLDRFVLALRGPLFIWRAALEASGLEVVPLAKDGSIDVEGREKVLRDRAAGRFDDVYGQLLGAPWQANVAHGPIAPDIPHVDVYSFAPRAGGPAWLLTAGMSTRPMAPGPGPGVVELACPVRPDLGSEAGEASMQALLALGLFPFRHDTLLAPGHSVRIGAPILPGSALTAWVLLPLDDAWAERLSDALPRHPELVLAVAVTEEELALKLEEGPAALRARLEAAAALTLDPARSSCV